MRLRNAILAVAVAALALAAFPASALEFHGYLRTGIGGNFRGGGQACFYMPGTDYKWRLGNECETYAELELRETLYKDRSGVEFTYTGLLAYMNWQRNNTESLVGFYAFQNSGSPIPWNGTEFKARQNWVGVNNLPFLGGASAWIGQRYYMRSDVHPLDWYIFDPSGPGAGVENINVADTFKLAVAAFVNKGAEPGYYPGPNDPTPRPVAASQVWRIDVRGYEIPFFVGNLTFAANVGILTTTAGTRTPGSQTVSSWFTLLHNWPGLLGGNNQLWLQYGHGTMSPINAYPSESSGSNAWQFRITDMWVFEPIPQFAGALVFSWQDRNHLYGSAAPGGYQGDSSTTWTLGVRPVWNVMNYFKLQGDFAWQSLTPKTNPGGRWGNTNTMNLFKATIAPTLAPLPGPGGSFWVRPELRVFVTYASWNEAMQANGGMDQGSCATTGTSTSVFGCSTNGFTFGAQVEAWW
jgi:maltoporin